MSDLLTSREAMAVLGGYTNIQAFNRAVHRLGIPHRYVGNRLRFDRARILAWVQTYKPTRKPKTEAA